MTVADFEPWIKLLSFLLSVGAIVFTFFATRRKDVDEKFEAITQRQNRHDERLSRTEQTLQSMPGKEDTHKLEMMMVEMAGDMKAMRATMKGMSESLTRTEDIVSRHEDHLRER